MFSTQWMKLAAVTVVAGAGLSLAPLAHAGGYYYAPVSYYTAPPILPQYSYVPVYQSLPVAVYQPVQVARAPVAGYYQSLPVVAAPVAAAPVVTYSPTARVYESWRGTPNHPRYRVNVVDPWGPDYRLRVRQNGNVVRYNERWGW